MKKIFSKIISGGQTGVDRAVLDAALELGLPVGGWCPKGGGPKTDRSTVDIHYKRPGPFIILSGPKEMFWTPTVP